MLFLKAVVCPYLKSLKKFCRISYKVIDFFWSGCVICHIQLYSITGWVFLTYQKNSPQEWHAAFRSSSLYFVLKVWKHFGRVTIKLLTLSGVVVWSATYNSILEKDGFSSIVFKFSIIEKFKEVILIAFSLWNKFLQTIPHSYY